MGAQATRLIPDCRISLDGQKLQLEHDAALVRVQVDLDADLFGRCALEFHDPRRALIDGKALSSGTPVLVELGFAHQLVKVFEGEVVALEPRFVRDVPPSLRVVCFESLHRLALSQMTRSFSDVDDAEITQQIAREHGLSGSAPAGTKEHVLQSNVTDAVFLRRLAQKHGNSLRIEGKKLIVGPPPQRAQFTVAPGGGLRKLKLKVAASQQVTEVTVHGWDSKAKREIVGRAKPAGEAGAVAQKHGKGSLAIAGHAPHPPDPATAERMAKGRLQRIAEGSVVATGEMIGDARLTPGAVMVLDHLGAGLEGKFRVDKARHEFSKHGYWVTFEARRIGRKDAPKQAPPQAAGKARAPTSAEDEAQDAPGLRTGWSHTRGKPGLEVELRAEGPKAKGGVTFEIEAIYEDGKKEAAGKVTGHVEGSKATAKWKVPPLDHLHQLPNEGQAQVHRAPRYRFTATGGGVKSVSQPMELGYDLEWDFVHEDGKPLGTERYRIQCADGSVIEGRLKGGHLSAQVPVGHVSVDVDGIGHEELDVKGEPAEVPQATKVSGAHWGTQRAKPGDEVTLEGNASGAVELEVRAIHDDGSEDSVASLRGALPMKWRVPELPHLHELPPEGQEPEPKPLPRYYFEAKAGYYKSRSGLLDVGAQLEWDFADPQGKPLANERYTIACADGQLLAGRLSGGHLSTCVPAGHVTVEIEGYAPHVDAPPAQADDEPLWGIPDLVRTAVDTIGDVRDAKEELTEWWTVEVQGGAMWKNLAWADVERDAAVRTATPDVGAPDGLGWCAANAGPSVVQQGDRGVCGPTSVIHALLDWDKDGYRRFLKDAFDTGRVFGKLVTESARNGSPSGQFGAADFLALVSLTSTKHEVLDWDGSPAGDLRTLALPEEVAGWMHKLLGCAETRIVAPIPNTPALAASRVMQSGVHPLSAESARAVSGLLRDHPRDVTCSLLICANRFINGADETPVPNHYVRLLAPMDFGPSSTTVRIHTWGHEKVCTFEHVEDQIFAYVLGSRLPGLLAGVPGVTLPDLGIHI